MSMINRLTIFIALMIFSFLNSFHLFADYITRSSNSSINWSKGYITAEGNSSIKIGEKGNPYNKYKKNLISINRARIDSYLEAREGAIVKIIEVIKSLRIDSDTTLNSLIIDNKFTQKRLFEVLSNSLKIKEYPIDFYSSKCKVKIRISDIITSIPYNFPSHDFPVKDDTTLQTYYSSLIIDGRDSNIIPMLFPSIYNEDGLEIYGRIYVDNKYLSKNGMVSYCYTSEEALVNKRAGEYPYFTVSIKEIKGCPVLSENDTRKILSCKKTIENLKKCKVIIILNKNKG